MKGGHGGKFVEDIFEVKSFSLIDLLIGKFNTIGHGALVFRDNNNTAVMLVPPFEFRFRTQRQASSDVRAWPTVLSVTGHFMCLVDRKGPRGPLWAFDDARVDYPKENKHSCKIALAAAMHALGPEVVPARILTWLNLLFPEQDSDSD